MPYERPFTSRQVDPARGDLYAVAPACPTVGWDYRNKCKMLDVAATDPDDYLRVAENISV
jgi:hypothetical protein